MKMSGTKPMKNTMRKPSPLKFMGTDAVMSATKKVSDAVGAAAKKAKATKAEGAKTTTTMTKKTTVPAKIKNVPTTASKETKKAAATAAMDKTAKPALMQMKKRKC